MNFRFLSFIVLPLSNFLHAEVEFFESKIRPVLSEKCYECHSSKSSKIKGGLRLDHIDRILDGGDSGSSLIVGKPNESLLIEAIRYDDQDFHMPPKEKLPKQVVQDFEKWILDGAFWPKEPIPTLSPSKKRTSFDLEKRRNLHWCWQPIKKPSISPSPSILNDGPIDYFIRKELSNVGILPAQEGDKRTWLRRITFDLLGLPPTLEEISNFVADESDQAFENVVDRLLSSNHYGEKWARHWMDLVRYAETCGHEFDYALEHPHEYRDYLIRAFNQDIPYDQFLHEHIAGDLIKEPRRHPSEKFNESIIGTGFWFFHEAVHAPTDPKVDNADRMENQLDVFGKTFLGLTIGCARCHDHKFDAISEKDYYSLAAFMQGSNRQEYPLDTGGKRKKVTDEINAICHSAFSSLSAVTENSLSPVLPSKYWKVALQIVAPNTMDVDEKAHLTGKTIADFETGFGEWKPLGKAFGKPLESKANENQGIKGYQGRRWASSFNKDSKKSIGSLVSPKFKVEYQYLNFLVGGGQFSEVGVELWADGERVIVSRGVDSDNLIARTWDLSEYRSNEVEIRLVDNATGRWSHIHADQFILSNSPGNGVQEKPVPPMSIIEQQARENGLEPSVLKSWCMHFKDLNNLFLLSDNFEVKKARYKNSFEQHQRILSNSITFADFNCEELPEGWNFTGEAFQPCGHEVLRLLSRNLFVNSETLSSNTLGNKRIGNLRSPHFKIEQDKILLKVNANKAFVRLVIDNYHMGKYSGLLFNGTVLKDVSTNGSDSWISLGNSKYKGHSAYIEIVDRGSDSWIEIDQVRFGNQVPGSVSSKEFAYLFDNEESSSIPLPSLLDQFILKIRSKLGVTKLDGKESRLLNYLIRHGLLELDLTPSINESKNKVFKVDAETNQERYVLAMGKGSPFKGNVYVRGSPHKLGEPVHGRNLTALGGQAGTRLDLADQLTSLDNPLVARVMANRIWLQFFGRGIVPTPDDFGPMGQEPSHSDLLDWLASDFRENHWSVKNLIRKIVLSKTYRQSSTQNPSNNQNEVTLTDPQNILLYKMPVRRLQAEAIRDSILSFSGRLDTKMFGKSISVHRTAFMTGRGGKGSGPLDGAGRRSIYGSVYRNFISPFMLAFDQPAPFGTKGKRSVSNVPAQSLALLNDPFVIDQCKLMGKKAINTQCSKDDAVRNLYETITGKIPNTEVQEKLLTFVDTQSNGHGGMSEQVWADLAHVLINSKSFLFLN
jgi:hypothetical protein